MMNTMLIILISSMVISTLGAVTYATSTWRMTILTLSSRGRFILRIRKSTQGVVRALIGCQTRPRITSVYTKEKNGKVTMEVKVLKRHILRPDEYIDMVQRVLR